MLISFHFEDTLLATSFIKSDSPGSLSSPVYLLPKPASEEICRQMDDHRKYNHLCSEEDFKKKISTTSWFIAYNLKVL